METMTVPNVMINRIARERLILDKLYSKGILDTEHAKQMNTEKLHELLGGDLPDFNRYVQTLANEGIIVRESQYQKGFRRGRVSFWKLGIPKEQAFEKLDMIHGKEIAKANEPAIPKNSIKNRILRALEEKGEFETAVDLCEYINKNGEMHVLPHKATHILHDIQTQGLVDFDKTKIVRGRKGLRKSNGTIVVNIRWLGNKKTKPVNDVETIQPVVAQIDDPEPLLISPTPAETPTVEFPLIKEFINKRVKLSALADAAADMGEDDVALMLMDRAEIKDPFMLEVISLWNAYQECKSG